MKTPERGLMTETMKNRLVHLEGGIVEVAEAYNKVKKALCGNTNVPLREVLQTVDQLKSRLAQVERENKAMLHDMARYTMCGSCKHFSDGEKCPQHDKCVYGEIGHFVWRGVCEENTKED